MVRQRLRTHNIHSHRRVATRRQHGSRRSLLQRRNSRILRADRVPRKTHRRHIDDQHNVHGRRNHSNLNLPTHRNRPIQDKIHHHRQRLNAGNLHPSRRSLSNRQHTQRLRNLNHNIHSETHMGTRSSQSGRTLRDINRTSIRNGTALAKREKTTTLNPPPFFLVYYRVIRIGAASSPYPDFAKLYVRFPFLNSLNRPPLATCNNISSSLM